MKNTFRFFKIIILSALTGIFFISCTEESLSVSISVSASSSTVSRGGTVNFTAVIEGMANIPQGVTWSIFGDDSENSGGTGYSGDPYILTPNTWVSGEGEYEYGYNYGKTSRNIYYSFDVVYGNIYYIWWDDSYTSSSTNIYVSYTNGGGSISVNSDTSSVFFTPHTNGTVLVRFDMNYNGDCTDGIFTAAYSTTGTKPSASNGNTVISSAGVLTVANNETRGTLTIQAASHFDRYLTAAVDITVIQPVITISPANVSVERGGTQSFSASIAGSDNPFQNIIWSLEQGAGTRDEPFPLTYNAWENGEITSTEFSSSVWYSINVASGSEHYIWWNDANDGDNSKTLDVLVSAFYSNGAQIFSNTDSGYSSSRYVYFSETILIKVSPKNSGSIGTFAVAFNNSGSMPTAVNSYNASTSIDANGVLTVAADETRTRFTVRAAAPLDKVSAAAVVTIPTAPIPFNTWVDGNITSNNAWFSFDVSKSATYCVWWNDSNDGDGIKTLDVSVSAYYSDGTLIFSDFDSGYTNYKSFYTDRSDTVLIKVSPAAPGGTGTFALAYNTSGSRSGIKNGIPLTRN
ncbi:MAG: hypothetical protein FWB83_09190, partial [Treponema sp.]|nr:hypothetical protein [Treponema sp.]